MLQLWVAYTGLPDLNISSLDAERGSVMLQDLPSIGYFNPILVEKKLLDTDAQYRSARLSVQSVFMEPTLVINPNLTCTATQRPAEGVLFWRSYPPLQLEFNNAPLKMVPRLVMQTWSVNPLLLQFLRTLLCGFTRKLFSILSMSEKATLLLLILRLLYTAPGVLTRLW